MKIGLVTDCLSDLSFTEMLKTCNKLGIQEVELGCGNWSSAPHIDLDDLLEDKSKRKQMKDLLTQYEIKISAFNCSGNPLAPGKWGESDDSITRKTFELSEYFEVDTVVMMSGLPGAGPRDEYPNWIVTSWPPHTLEALEYQWNEVAIPYWKKTAEIAEKHGIKKIALEPHGMQLVHNVENFFKLRKETGNILGFNMDPSHLFWMGADPISVTRELADFIYHVHIKDVRIEKPAQLNTLLDGKHVLEYPKRSWNFAIPGYGHDEYWWKTFIVTLKMIGYDGVLSIEHEDYSMDVLDGVTKTVSLLKRNIV